MSRSIDVYLWLGVPYHCFRLDGIYYALSDSYAVDGGLNGLL